MIIWFTGIPASGKTTHAKLLQSQFPNFIHIDADDFRATISSDLEYDMEDRTENQRRMRELIRLLQLSGKQDIIVSTISPLQSHRDEVCEEFKNVIIVYCNASIELCKSRDEKGIYSEHRKYVTGMDSPYEVPRNANIILDTSRDIQEQSDILIEYISLWVGNDKHIAFIGRWNPLHDGHKEIIRKTYHKKGLPILIMVRETIEDYLTPLQRCSRIANWLRKEGIPGKVTTIPDIEGIYYGRKVGYNIEQICIDESLENISGTSIREEQHDKNT